MNLVPTGTDGFEPAFPEGVSFQLLADLPNEQACWGIYRFTVDLDRDWRPEAELEPELANLLASAERYPPALALARADLKTKFRDAIPSQKEFAAALEIALKALFAEQPTAGYLLAESNCCEPGYLSPGQWQWIVAATKSSPQEVWWVSDDFFMYRNRASDFRLTAEQLAALPKTEPGKAVKGPDH